MNRYLQAIFCDDIRQEVGGKLSYIGVYGRRLIVSQFPATLPKFFVALTAVTPESKPFQSLTFKLFEDDRLLGEHVFPEEEVSAYATLISQTGPRQNGVQTISSALMLSPLVIAKPCLLRVRAQTESEELSSPGLEIEIAGNSS